MSGHSALRFEFFGGPVLFDGDKSVPMSPFQISLLTLLLAEGRERLPRQQLQSLLWEEADTGKTRHRLSQLLYQVNQRVARRLAEVEGDSVRVYQGIVSCDLDDFEEYIRRPEFKSAADLIRRGFLSAFPAPPSEAFEDWMDLRRVEMRSRLREKALGSWAAAEASQDWAAGRRAAEALLLLDPRDEVILRRVMKARAMGGMVREAEAVYLGFADRLARGGEWEPQPETAALLASVRATFQRPQLPPDIAIPPTLEVPLCGREEELAYLTRSIFNERAAGRRSTVVICGEAGLGKTRLVEEALQGARFRGYRVLRARPAELERNIPLNPLLEALNQDWVGDVLRGLEDPWRSVLLGLMPQFHEGPGPLPEVPYVQPGSLPRRTYEAFFRLFRAVSEQSPTLLFVDDFQWADETSAAVLQFMHRRSPPGDLGLILTYRQGELSQGELVGRLTAELESDGAVLAMRLEELDQAASTQLVESVALRSLSESARREVVGLAGGNPFFLIELTADYMANRTPQRMRNGVPLPLSVRQMITRRVRELDMVSKQIVSGLSAFVHPCSLGRLTRMTGFAREECVDGLETLQRLRLVDWAGGGVSCRHDIVRRAVYDDLSPARRALLHGRIAEMLESEPGNPPKDQLALHYYQAGERELALRYALEAADEAEVSGSNEEMISALRLAIATSEGECKTRIRARLAVALFDSRHLADSIDHARNALLSCDHLTDDLRIALELNVANAERLLGLKTPRETLQTLTRLGFEALSHEAEELYLDVLDTKLHVLDRAGESEYAAALINSVANNDPFSSDKAQCKALSIQMMAYLFGEVDKGLEAGRQAVALARRSGLQSERLRALHRFLLGLLLAGQLESDEGRGVVAESLECASASGDLVSHALLLSNLASWYLSVADCERANMFLSRLEERIAATDSPSLRFLCHANRGGLHLEMGNTDQAIASLAMASNVADAAVSPHQYRLFQAILAMAEMEAGRIGEAARISADLDVPSSWVADESWIFILHGRLAARQGYPGRAVEILEGGMRLSEGKMPVAWLRMASDLMRLSRRAGVDHDGLAQQALDLASALRLPYLAERFRASVS